MEKMDDNQNPHIGTSAIEATHEGGTNNSKINSLTNNRMHNNQTCSKIHLHQTHNNPLSMSSTQTLQKRQEQ